MLSGSRVCGLPSRTKSLLKKKTFDDFMIGYNLTSDYLSSYVVVSILHRQTMIEQYLFIIRKKVNSDLLVVAKIFKYSLQ